MSESKSCVSSMKVFSLEDVGPMMQQIAKQKVVVAGGCFDILHFGHVTFLGNAKKEGDILVVVLESDDFIKKFKNREPVHTQEERAHILAELISVDYVVKLPLFQSQEEYYNMLKTIAPTVIAVTQGDTKIELKKAHAQLLNAEVKEVVTLLPFASSTIIYETIFRN